MMMSSARPAEKSACFHLAPLRSLTARAAETMEEAAQTASNEMA